MTKVNDIALLFFRISIASFMLFGHGLGKLTKLLSGAEIKFFDPFGLGPTLSFILIISAEFFAAAFIFLGLFTRISSLILVIGMFVAAFIYHADDPFGGKEKALIYLVSFLLLFITGPGKYSIQKFISSKIEKLNGSWKKFLLG